MIADCPVPTILNVVQVVLTSDSDAGKTIHAEYRYIDGTFVGPLQSAITAFQSGTSNPLVSLYNMTTGYVGAGGFPTDGSDVVIQTNKIAPDDFDFNLLTNRLRYLRSTTFYDNTPTEIASLLAASILSTPITSLGSVFKSQFTMPSTASGDYLYLIYDLRSSFLDQLCYTDDGSEPSLKEICCDCAPCEKECIELIISNLSPLSEARVSFPLGLCGEDEEAIITLNPSEIVTICVRNAPFTVLEGDVTITELECSGCTGCYCDEYDVVAGAVNCMIDYYTCDKKLEQIIVLKNESALICVSHTSPAPVVLQGNPTITLTTSCSCSS
jgi:hypothetical protein